MASSFRRFFRDFMATTGRKGRLVILYVLGGAILEGVGFSLLVPLLALIFASHSATGLLATATRRAFAFAGAETPATRSLLLLAVFGLVMTVRALVFAARDIALHETQLAFLEAQRMRIAASLVEARWDCIARLRHSRVTSLMSSEIQRLGIGTELMLRGCAGLAILTAQIALAFLLSPLLATAIALVLAFGTLALWPLLARARQFGEHVTDANLTLVAGTDQFLSGLKQARSQNLEAGFLEKTRETLHSLALRQSQYMRRQIRSQTVLALLSAVLGSGLLLAGFGWLHIAPPVLITLLLVVTRMVAPASQVYKGAQQFAQALAIYERAGDLCRTLAAAARDDVIDDSAACPDGEIVFDNVAFRHRGAEGARPGRGIRGVNLVIGPGEFLGITGPSGAGKTTFADLLVGLQSPQAGRITVRGMPLEGATLNAWRNTLSYVSQDQFVMHDTVRRNLTWVRPDASDAEIWAALEVAGADDMVRRMEHGLDTVLGERGALISGGERQRIALARALLRRPRLLVLDEATAAIDADSELAIFHRIRALRPRPTIIVIAHRTENLSVCDRVVRFEATGVVRGAARGEMPVTAQLRSPRAL